LPWLFRSDNFISPFVYIATLHAKTVLYFCGVESNEAKTQKQNKMQYTAKQIKAAKSNYNAMLVIRTVASYQPEFIGRNAAEQRCEYHNGIVSGIKAGNKEMEKEWKLFFLNQEVKADQKNAESKSKLAANKEASSDILAPIKAAKRIVEFGKWLNTSGNQFRKEHFSKNYTQQSVSTFLSI